VLVARALNGGLSVRTDRPDCGSIASHRGCAVESLQAEGSTWFRRLTGAGMDWYYKPPQTAWYGLSFLQDLPHESDCADMCWSPAYTHVGRVGAGRSRKLEWPWVGSQVTTTVTTKAAALGLVETTTTVSTTTTSTTPSPPLPTVIVRAAIDAVQLQKVAEQSEKISRGEVFICTESGELVAGSDMADIIRVDPETGAIRPRALADLDRPWVMKGDSEQMGTFVRKAYPDRTYGQLGYRVSAHVLKGFTEETRTLGDDLRLVIAVPNESFVDDVIGNLVTLSLGTSAAPLAVVLLLTLWSGYLKFFAGTQPDAEIGLMTRLS